MAKKMKPEKNLPNEGVGSTVFNGSEPDIVVAKFQSSALENVADAPTQTPPAEVASGAFGAAVWHNDKRVNALYNTYHPRNSWMSIVGTGWVRLSTASDSATEAMTVLAAHARVKNARVDYAVDGGQVTEIYVW